MDDEVAVVLRVDDVEHDDDADEQVGGDAIGGLVVVIAGAVVGVSGLLSTVSFDVDVRSVIMAVLEVVSILVVIVLDSFSHEILPEFVSVDADDVFAFECTFILLDCFIITSFDGHGFVTANV